MSTISIIAGNDFSTNKPIVEGATGAETVVDLTGATVTCEVRSATSATIVLTPSVVIADAANGIVTVSATAAETDGITAGNYKYDFRYVIAGNVQNTAKSDFVVAGPITES